MSVLWRRRRGWQSRSGAPSRLKYVRRRVFARKDADAGCEQERSVDPPLVSPRAPRGAHAGCGRRPAAPDRRLDPAMRRAHDIEREGRSEPAAAGRTALCDQRQHLGPARPARGRRLSPAPGSRHGPAPVLDLSDRGGARDGREGDRCPAQVDRIDARPPQRIPISRRSKRTCSPCAISCANRSLRRERSRRRRPERRGSPV